MKIYLKKFRLNRLPLIFLIIFSLMVMIVNIPVSWAKNIIAERTNCKVILLSPQGNFWSGSTSLGVSKKNSGGNCESPIFMTEGFHWDTSCQPLSIKCSVIVTSPSLGKELRLTLFNNGMTISENEMSLPLKMLEDLGAPWNTLKIDGQSELRWSSIDLKDTSSKGQVNVDLINLKSALSTISPLGDYRITIDLSPMSTFQVRTLKGALEIKGQGQIKTNGIEFKGEAKALPENKESLIGLLSVLGKNQGDTTLLQF